MVSLAENEKHMEDIEEGEIVDYSDKSLNDDNSDDHSLDLQRKATLNDLATSRYWDNVGRIEEGQRFVDQEPKWRMEGLQFSTSNGNYYPNLYTLAWVNAVQSKAVPWENSNTINNNSTSKEEIVKNGRGSMKLRELGRFCDNDERLEAAVGSGGGADDEREEGELEEGEIEMEMGSGSLGSPNIETRTDAYSLRSIDSLDNANEVTYILKTYEAKDDTLVLTSTNNYSRASGNSIASGGATEFSNLSPDKPWEDTEPNGSNLPTPTREDSSASWNQQNLRSISAESQTFVKSSIPFARITKDETDESGFCPPESMRALKCHQEKFSLHGRMPSPTPSEDNKAEEASTSDGNTKSQSIIEEKEMTDTDNDENASVWREVCCHQINLDTKSMDPGNQHGSSLKVVVPVSQKDVLGEIETTKSTNLTGGSSMKALSKSRYPRRPVTESEFHTVDLNSQPCLVESNIITKEQVEGALLFRKHKADDDSMEEIHCPKRHRYHSANHYFSNNSPMRMFESGGWLEENAVIPSSTDWDQTLEMEVTSTSDLTPCVLNAIAVNPTMLRNLLKHGQESLSSQGIQNIEKHQQANSTSTPIGTLFEDMAVTKCSTMVLPSPLQSLTDENIVDAQNQPNPWGDIDHLLEAYNEEQRFAIHQERARRIEEQNKMFCAKKLCLVLDLDHTLLNSVKFVEVEHKHHEILRKKEEQDRERSQRQLFRFPHMGMWTKLRPGIWNFLARASKLYELHVCTMGNKVYATEMAKILDPNGTLFAGRVISKGDEADIDGDDRLPKSKDLDGVLGMESSVVIIDDSASVWPHHRHNLIVVERYMYFPCSRRQFGLPGPSLLEADLDERREHGTLASSLALIERIHHNFFSSKVLHQVDVRNILAAEQRKILEGCKVVFSRVFPIGEVQPHLHPLWQIAEQFGATCSTSLDDQVTHVVAVAPGTDKVNWAKENNRFVVHPGWIEASVLLYRRANEKNYTIVTNYPYPIH